MAPAPRSSRLELRAPVPVGVELVDQHRPLLAAVPGEVALPVAVEVERDAPWRGPSTGCFQTPVYTVRPLHATFRGSPTLTETSVPTCSPTPASSRITGGRGGHHHLDDQRARAARSSASDRTGCTSRPSGTPRTTPWATRTSRTFVGAARPPGRPRGLHHHQPLQRWRPGLRREDPEPASCVIDGGRLSGADGAAQRRRAGRAAFVTEC